MRSSIPLLFLLFVSPAWANSASDYALAQKCYHDLDKSSGREWNRCIGRFEKLAEKNPQTEHGRKALFNVARLHQERFERFTENSDLKDAFKNYNEFLRRYPKDALADDALYRIASLRYEKERDPGRAVIALETMLERYPNGDMAKPARSLLTRLETSSPIITVTKKEDELQEENLTEEPLKDIQENNEFTIRTIVIDPGHGGEDAGARGRKGTKESIVSLQIARKLAYHLSKTLPVKVLMTRTNNKTLSLSERNHFANKHNADLFISIHANASTIRDAHGVQTFYLDNATSSASEQLASFENKVLGKSLDLSSRVLTTMLQNANTEDSRVLAGEVHKSLVDDLSNNYSAVKDLQVSTALFDVLIGVKAPSILVETAFITHPREEARLRDSSYQWKVARGIANGVKKFIKGHQQTPRTSL
ncbi:MAG: N-acetylmuramoyl-L-alanine amidase [Deltaproteobacteria bacterium]|nr:N-acetylmuramoyl-L-alanine amidase [Deltaproteobacteria bacterium]